MCVLRNKKKWAFLGVQPIMLSQNGNTFSLALIPPPDLGFYEPTVVLAFNHGNQSEATVWSWLNSSFLGELICNST